MKIAIRIIMGLIILFLTGVFIQNIFSWKSTEICEYRINKECVENSEGWCDNSDYISIDFRFFNGLEIQGVRVDFIGETRQSQIEENDSLVLIKDSNGFNVVLIDKISKKMVIKSSTGRVKLKENQGTYSRYIKNRAWLPKDLDVNVHVIDLSL